MEAIIVYIGFVIFVLYLVCLVFSSVALLYLKTDRNLFWIVLLQLAYMIINLASRNSKSSGDSLPESITMNILATVSFLLLVFSSVTIFVAVHIISDESIGVKREKHTSFNWSVCHAISVAIFYSLECILLMKNIITDKLIITDLFQAVFSAALVALCIDYLLDGFKGNNNNQQA